MTMVIVIVLMMKRIMIVSQDDFIGDGEDAL